MYKDLSHKTNSTSYIKTKREKEEWRIILRKKYDKENHKGGINGSVLVQEMGGVRREILLWYYTEPSQTLL